MVGNKSRTENYGKRTVNISRLKYNLDSYRQALAVHKSIYEMYSDFVHVLKSQL